MITPLPPAVTLAGTLHQSECVYAPSLTKMLKCGSILLLYLISGYSSRRSSRDISSIHGSIPIRDRSASPNRSGAQDSPNTKRVRFSARLAHHEICNIMILSSFNSSNSTVLDPDPPTALTVGKRMDRKINSVDTYRTVWYPSTGSAPVDADTLAQLDLTPEPRHADIFFHQYGLQQRQLFLCERRSDTHKWIPIEREHQHPQLKSHRLNIKPTGILGWVKSETISTYKGPARMRGTSGCAAK